MMAGVVKQLWNFDRLYDVGSDDGMKLPLKYFLLVCLLLGAVGVPLGWKVYQARLERLATEKDAEIERLWNELFELWDTEPNDESKYEEWKARVESVQDRLEHLEGERPERPIYFILEVGPP